MSANQFCPAEMIAGAGGCKEHGSAYYQLLFAEHSAFVSALRVFLVLWGIAEVVFYFIFRLYLIPKANKRTQPTPYREPFGSSRVTLLKWILHRILSDANCGGTKGVIDDRKKAVLSTFLVSWFQEIVPPANYLKKSSTVSSYDDCSSDASGSAADGGNTGANQKLYMTSPCSTSWTIPGLTKENLHIFLAWVLFGKEVDQMDDEDHVEMDACFKYLEEELDISYDLVTPPRYLPRRMSLEDVDPWHRPLVVYVSLGIVKMLAGLFLSLVGFRFVQSKTGLTGWLRQGKDGMTPLLFFHGIAPAGFSFYLPLVFQLIDNRPCLLVDNPNISCVVQFSAVSEDRTVQGVKELVDTYFGGDRKVTLVGHSFGSCPISWLLASEMKSRVRDVYLLDPVTILLSNSDVMVNFLYSKGSFSKIRMLASSELFTEYYLRRHFSWYNSELWLKDVTDIPITVGLAEDDEIVASEKVLAHCQQYKNVDVIHWPSAGHAAVVMDPRKWEMVRERLYTRD